MQGNNAKGTRRRGAERSAATPRWHLHTPKCFYGVVLKWPPSGGFQYDIGGGGPTGHLFLSFLLLFLCPSQQFLNSASFHISRSESQLTPSTSQSHCCFLLALSHISRGLMDKEAVSPLQGGKRRNGVDWTCTFFEVLWRCFKRVFWGLALQIVVYSWFLLPRSLSSPRRAGASPRVDKVWGYVQTICC